MGGAAGAVAALPPDPASAPDPVLPPDPWDGVLHPLPDEPPEIPHLFVDDPDLFRSEPDVFRSEPVPGAPVPLPHLDAGAWPPPGLLDETAPGPLLATLAAEVDLRGCRDDQVVEVAAAAHRLQSWAAALELAATSALLNRVTGWRNVRPRGQAVPGSHVSAETMAAAELGAALSLSPGSARNRVQLGQAIRRLPATRAALAAGRIDLYTARTVVDTLSVLDDAAAAAVEARVLARADGRTCAQIRASLRRAALSVDPESAQSRHRRAVAERGVSVFPLADGMAQAAYVDDATKVIAFADWLTAQAELARAGDPAGARRSLDQCRADVLGDLGEQGLAGVTGVSGAPRGSSGFSGSGGSGQELPRRQGRRPQVHVVVSLTTLLGLDDQPAELGGYGPIPASVARRVASDGTWRRLLTDPRTGRFDELSLTTYQPSQDLRDHVVARDRTCRGPGCRLPADRCDLDHRVPHPRGPTSPGNLYAACRPFHEIKTLTDTVVTDDGEGGLHVTFPSGRRYRRPAEPVLEDLSHDVPPF